MLDLLDQFLLSRYGVDTDNFFNWWRHLFCFHDYERRYIVTGFSEANVEYTCKKCGKYKLYVW